MPQTLILVTILLITQSMKSPLSLRGDHVTELKLLFETQVTKHRFYYVILASLVTCIVIEIVIGLVTVYMTQKRINLLNKIPLESDHSQSHPPPSLPHPSPPHPSPPHPSNSNRYTQFSNEQATKQYHIFRHPPLSTTSTTTNHVTSTNVTTSQSTTFIASTSQTRHNLPFADSSSESLSSTNQKLPPIPENSTAADNALFTIARFNDDEDISIKAPSDELNASKAAATKTTATKGMTQPGCCFGCYDDKGAQDKHLLKMWQNLHFYLLYVVMVLNVFITAFGLSGDNIKLPGRN